MKLKLSDLIEADETEVVEKTIEVLYEHKSKPVPNKFPSITNAPYRIAIIGEAPGRDEEIQGTPFVGMSGRFLNALLSKAGIAREACFIGNVCQYRPPNNDAALIQKEWLDEGIKLLRSDLLDFGPNLCLLLGKTALKAFTGHPNIGDWRGSLLLGRLAPDDETKLSWKCLPSYHPAACLRQYEWTAPLLFDLHKARREGETPSLVLPQRILDVNLNAEDIVYRLSRIKEERPLISIDIEGGVSFMSCISVAISPQQSFIIPFTGWEIDDEVKIWRALSSVLEDPQIPKVLQNSLYDRFVLQYSYHIPVRGVVDDTMLKHWEKFCELEKGLGFLCSIYTKEPYYKGERKTDDNETFWRYCCKDSAVTYEINNAIKLDEQQTAHYRFNINLLNPILYMELRGIKYDSKKAKERLKEVNHHIYRLQHDLDALAGVGFTETDSRDTISQRVRDVMCYKKNPTHPKKEYAQAYDWCTRVLLGEADLTKEELSRINIELGLSLNIKGKDFKDYVYKTLKSPPQYAPITKALSTNYESLLKIQKLKPHPTIDLAIQIGSLRTRAQMLEISADNDGRIRCGYNIVGTETGRLTCYTSPTGSGYNLQTIPSTDELKPVDHPLHHGMRDLFVADPNCYLFQCDLSGADGWTVAAHLASLGDRTMLEDYLYGIKPAKVLCYLFRHGAGSLSGRSREEIKELTKEVKGKDWDYFLCKVGQHGSCYLMGARKLANQVFILSEGKITINEKETKNLQELFFIRYRVKLWHSATERKLAQRPELVSSSGHKRRFFGRREELLGQALAHEPQANTTYATNLAAWRLWSDLENRLSNRTERVGVGLRIEPLHQVHDALLGQFQISDTAWAINKIKSYFDNTIIIAGQPIKIPFEGAYGPSWGNLTTGTI